MALAVSVIDVVGYLDQVFIRIPEVNRNDVATRAAAWYRPVDDLDAAGFEFCHDLVHRIVDDKTQIGAARLHPAGPGFEFPTALVQVDFLFTEAERNPAGAEFYFFHAHQVAIKLDSALDIGNGQYQVIDSIGFHLIFPGHGSPLASNR